MTDFSSLAHKIVYSLNSGDDAECAAKVTAFRGNINALYYHNGMTRHLLTWTIGKKRPATLRALATRGDVDPNVRFADNLTPLMYGALCGRAAQLLAAFPDADVDARGGAYGRTALHMATTETDVLALLDAGADPSLVPLAQHPTGRNLAEWEADPALVKIVSTHWSLRRFWMRACVVV